MTSEKKTDQRRAITLVDLYSLVPRIKIKKTALEIAEETSVIPRGNDGVRNLVFSKLTNVGKLAIVTHQPEIVWEASVKGDEKTIVCNLWLGLNILPNFVAPFAPLRLRVTARDEGQPFSVTLHYEEFFIEKNAGVSTRTWLLKLNPSYEIAIGRFLCQQDGVLCISDTSMTFDQQSKVCSIRDGFVAKFGGYWSIRAIAHELNTIIDDQEVRGFLLKDPREAMVYLTSPPQVDLYFDKSKETDLFELLRRKYPSARFSGPWPVQVRDEEASKIESQHRTREATLKFRTLVGSIDANQAQPTLEYLET